jgi:hypothetical protein
MLGTGHVVCQGGARTKALLLTLRSFHACTRSTDRHGLVEVSRTSDPPDHSAPWDDLALAAVSVQFLHLGDVAVIRQAGQRENVVCRTGENEEAAGGDSPDSGIVSSEHEGSKGKDGHRLDRSCHERT